ncbi:hypothetical protein [Fulvimarina sp. MAC8]|uniref:hypothetical protein n=1 Tax=Fulvimarina sp. MAC8 TaxID=3162874 RepID=UPI0032F003AC
MFKTTLIAATLAATAIAAPASAQALGGSEYYKTQNEEAARESVADAPRSTAVDATRVYGYSQTVPGSDYGRHIAEQQTRAAVQADTAGVNASSVNPGSTQIVPGSDYGRHIAEQQTRDSVR